MARVGFNVRKKRILELLDGKKMTTEEVATAIGINESTARHHLLRYWRYRLLNRTGGGMTPSKGRKPFVYNTSTFGSKKIKMLKTTNLKK